MCQQGASALNSIVRDFPLERVKVLVVWEPILPTDIEPPSNRELARISDRRAAQFWDRNRQVSRAISRPIVAHGPDRWYHYRLRGETLWDTVAVYKAGILWGEDAPLPSYTGGPVVDETSALRKALREAIEHPILYDVKPANMGLSQ